MLVSICIGIHVMILACMEYDNVHVHVDRIASCYLSSIQCTCMMNQLKYHVVRIKLF